MKNFQNFQLNSSETLNVIGGQKPDFAGSGKPDFTGKGRPDFAGTGAGRRGLGKGKSKMDEMVDEVIEMVEVVDIIAEEPVIDTIEA